jgi:hypothetical protein
MNMSGDDEILKQARSALLDALDALREHREAVIVIGAQAIYLHTGAAQVALAEATKDSDLALDARSLGDDPLVQEAMQAAGFHLDPMSHQPGAWLSPKGVPVDLLVPEALAGPGSTRFGKIPPHDDRATRRALGLEAALRDNAEMDIYALWDDDERVYRAKVAGPAALLIAKLHKLGERQATPNRLIPKDAHDVYRLLVAIPTDKLAHTISELRSDDLAGPVSEQAIVYLGQMFAKGADATGSVMAGRAEAGVGEPEIVANSVTLLAADLLNALEAGAGA